MYYTDRCNAYTVPAACLRPPFFSRSFPLSYNFGALGAIIGHEISHGFAIKGLHLNHFFFQNVQIIALVFV